jgi:hypothetical protein
MSNNIGTIDRWIRAAIGVSLLALVWFGPHTAWGYIGILPLFTAALGYCPLYQIFGWSTKTHERKAHAS